MASIEEKVEEFYKNKLDDLGIRHYGKTESINVSIDEALKEADSKSGKSGNNYPDIKCLLDNSFGRRIPVMIEAKGTKGKLEKLDKNDSIVGVTVYDKDTATHKAGEKNYSAVQQFAVNGAVHYGEAILDYKGYSEVIIIGINGTKVDDKGKVLDAECKAYYLSEKNNRVPILIERITADDWSIMKANNLDRLFTHLDKLVLTDKEIEALTRKAEADLESKVKAIHQSLYDDEKLKTTLGTNDKLYLFCGLIMAGLSTEGVKPLEMSDFPSNDDTEDNDGTVIVNRIKSFLKKKKCDADKQKMILSLLSPVFENKTLWKPNKGESVVKNLFKQVKSDIIPCLESNLHLDFTGKILNSLNDWVSIENDAANDVVLTPRYVTKMMAIMAKTSKDSYVWDKAMGSAGFLVSAMDLMIKDAEDKISDKAELEAKIKHIKENQLLGVEILGNIYILAVLNMILMGDGSSHIMKGDSHKAEFTAQNLNFPATVFLLNPPYSAEGKGFNFVEEALSQMTKGRACILIQENAGSGNGMPFTKRILDNNTLVASIHMPEIFRGKASVQTAVYVFDVARPHEADDIVTFIDFSEDGYTRMNRKKSNQDVNLRDTDDAEGRYAEVEAIVLGKKPKTSYYTEENGLVIRDTISLEDSVKGTDWTFAQHKKIDTTPTEEDFKKTVADYLSWKVSQAIKAGV